MSSSYRCTRDCWFRFGHFRVFVFSYLGAVCLFSIFGVFSPVCFELLSVPVQVITWKDSSPK